MNKITFVVRNGLPEFLRDEIEEIIKDVGFQDSIFVLDIKTHSVQLLVEDSTDLNPLVKRILGRGGLSILKHSATPVESFIVFGKLMDSVLTSTMANQAKGLFS